MFNHRTWLYTAYQKQTERYPYNTVLCLQCYIHVYSLPLNANRANRYIGGKKIEY